MLSFVKKTLNVIACSSMEYFRLKLTERPNYKSNLYFVSSSICLLVSNIGSHVYAIKKFLTLVMMFLIGAYLVKRDRLLQWLVFFFLFFLSSDNNLTLICDLTFHTIETTKTIRPSPVNGN